MHNRPRLCGAPQAGLRCSTALLIHPLHARMCPKHRILSANKAATHATASVGMLGMTVVSAGYWPPPYSSACSSQASHAAAGVVERSRLRMASSSLRALHGSTCQSGSEQDAHIGTARANSKSVTV